jgi:hypothetical protein
VKVFRWSLAIKFGDFTNTGKAIRTLITVYGGMSFDVPRSVWGIVYLYSGYAKCLLPDKRTTPHFLFAENGRPESAADINLYGYDDFA